MKRILLICIFLLVILSAGAVSANDDQTNTTGIHEQITDNEILKSEQTQVLEKDDFAENVLSAKKGTHNLLDPEEDNLYFTTYEDELVISDDGYYDFGISDLPDNCLDEFNIYVDGAKIDYYGGYHAEEDWPSFLEGSFRYDFTPGNHTFKIEYPGDSYYKPYTKVIQFNATPAIIIIPKEMYKTTLVEMYVPNSRNSRAIIYVNGSELINENITYNHYQTYLEGLDFGIWEIEVKYVNGAKTFSKKETVDLTYEIEITQWDEHVIDNTLTVWIDRNLDSKLFDVEIDGKNASFEGLNGSLDIDISNLKYGMHNLTVTYPGDGYYPKKTFNTTFKSVYRDRIVGLKKITLFYGTGGKYSLKIYGGDGKLVESGKKVTFAIDNIYYRNQFFKKTGENGIVVFDISKSLAPGRYLLEAYYKNGFDTADLIIKHVVTLKTVAVKKSAKKLVLTATLKNKKPMKGKTVTFKFNGKTYKAQTNAKGIAKVTIKSNVLKKLKVGKKLTYQATYQKDTVKKTVKVKK